MDVDQISESIKEAIRKATDSGRFVVFGYSRSPRRTSSIILGMTTRRSYSQVLLRIEHIYPKLPVHAGTRLDPSLLESLTRSAVGVDVVEVDIPGFNADEPGGWQLVGKVIARHMPRRWTHRGFALFDISGFSENPVETQLTKRLMLDGALLWARMVVGKYFEAVPDQPSLTFSRVSTGDGYYLWSTRPGPIEDASTFAMMLLAMGYVRVRERWDREWEIRAGFTVGSAVTLPYFGSWTAMDSDYLFEDAIGPALNSLARILSRAAPSQVLIGDFSIDDALYALVFSDPASLVSFTKTLSPVLVDPLESVPGERLRVVDKHGDVFHCFNVAGKVRTRDETRTDKMQDIGVVPDDAKDIGAVVFVR